MSRINDLNSGYNLVKSKYKYKSDLLDEWNDYSDVVLSGHSIEGDCEDFCMTVVAVLIKKYNLPKDNFLICRVCTQDGVKVGKAFDHAIAVYVEEDVWWVIDNLQQGVVKYEHTDYKWWDYSRIPITHWNRFS